MLVTEGIYRMGWALFLCCVCLKSFGQLEHIPRVQSEIMDSANLRGIVLITTRDNHSRWGAPNHYTSSLQIIDPLQPWPPLFFSNIKVSKTDIGTNGFFQDLRFQEEARQLTFFQASPDKKGGNRSMYFICDTNFAVIDSFRGSKGYITGHGFQINSKGERLYFANEDTVLDLSKFSGIAADSAVLVDIQLIEILDKNDSLVFSWNPLDHIPLSDTYVKLHEIGERDQLNKGWNWSRATSVRFTRDGNIIYSYRYIGVGKINRQTGQLIWKLGGKSPTIMVPENGKYYRQHDFQEIAPDTYSVFSNGNDENPCKVIIYKVNEKESKANVTRTIQPSPPVFSSHGGNYQVLDSGMYLLNYGNDISFGDWHPIFEFADTAGKVYAKYYLPCMNHTFQAHFVKSWKPVRPEVFNESGLLKVNGTSGSVSWYELKDSALIYLGESPTWKPERTGTYLATTKAGFGWLVSRPFFFH